MLCATDRPRATERLSTDPFDRRRDRSANDASRLSIAALLASLVVGNSRRIIAASVEFATVGQSRLLSVRLRRRKPGSSRSSDR